MNANWMESISGAWEWVIWTSLESSLLLAFVLLVSRISTNRLPLSPWISCALWVMAGLRLLLPEPPESSWSVFNLVRPVDGETEDAWKETTNLIERPAGKSLAQTEPEAAWKPSHWTGLLWLAGAAGIVGTALGRFLAMRRWVGGLPVAGNTNVQRILRDCAAKANVRRLPLLLEGPKGTGVMVCGFLRAEWLIIPQGFSADYREDQIRGILLHELEHVRRGDLFWNWIILLVQAIHWFNPLVWLAGRAFRAEREYACDRSVVAGLSAEERANYGRALLRAVEEQLRPLPAPAPSLMPFISPKKELKQRLTMILKPQSHQPFAQIATALVAVALGLTTFTAATADEPVAISPEAEAAPKTDPKDGEGAPKTGPKDGEGAPRQVPRTAKALPRPGPRTAKALPRPGPRTAKALPRPGPRKVIPPESQRPRSSTPKKARCSAPTTRTGTVA